MKKLDIKQGVYGFYRARVVNNKDQQKYGRVLVWIPDLMSNIPDDQGIFARPANNPMGGRNTESSSDCYYSGTSYNPKVGSWVWIFFEGGNPSNPFYFASLDLENAKVLPECQVGTNYEDKWVIFKSSNGRCIVVSDDPYDQRVEITGKKRNISNPPSGDTNSVYEIDGNQTTILLDERTGKEKILVRTYKGDFININVSDRKLEMSFDNDITIKTNGNLNIITGKNLNIKCNRNIQIQSILNIGIRAGLNCFVQGTSGMNIKSLSSLNIQSTTNVDVLTSGIVSLQGSLVREQMGATPALSPSTVTINNPEGDRDS